MSNGTVRDVLREIYDVLIPIEDIIGAKADEIKALVQKLAVAKCGEAILAPEEPGQQPSESRGTPEQTPTEPGGTPTPTA
jgi:hypothetical protein